MRTDTRLIIPRRNRSNNSAKTLNIGAQLKKTSRYKNIFEKISKNYCKKCKKILLYIYNCVCGRNAPENENKNNRNNAVNRMISKNIRGVDFVSVNTDRQALRRSDAATQIVIGEKITKGFGAGANPMIGARAAEESMEEIKQVLSGADMVFVTAGMGGGTGTGAAPIVARAAKEMGILTVGIVTKPFAFEGKRRMDQAESGIAELSQYVDSLIIIPNERLKQISDTRITLANAFEVADDVLRRGVQSISELINVTSFINLDFADVTSVMADAGYAHMGVGAANGKDKAELAAQAAISSPLLETSMGGATGIVISITASPDIGLEDIDLACTMISNQASEDASVIWGVAFDNELEDEMRITIIATGFNKKEEDDNRTITVTARAAAEEQKAEEAPAPAVKAAAKPAPKKVESDDIGFDDDDFDDMMSIFKNRK